MHGEAGALRRRKSRYKKPAPPPLKCSDPVRAAAGKDLPEQGGKGRRKERWGRGGGGETKRAEGKPFLPFRRLVGSQEGNKRREERRRFWEGGRRRKGVTNK